jgi:TATA-box binding protein (TBP) (component of TFIID and TFIIIB)
MEEIVQPINPNDFHRYDRYTTTYIAAVNWRIDHVALFQHAPIVQLDSDPLVGKKRATVRLPNIPRGSILQVKYRDVYKIVHVRGYGSGEDSASGCFNNSTTVVMYVDKIVVLKVPPQGKIQITGCKTEEQVYHAVHAIWRAIRQICKEHPEVSQIPPGEAPRVVYHGVMNNINLNLGFRLSNRKVHDFLYSRTEFNIIPNDRNYAGVTAKLEVEGLKDLPLVKHRFLNGKWYQSNAHWNEYLEMLPAKDRVKETAKKRYQSFLIFHSGKVIQSGPRYVLMEEVFRYFIELMNTYRADMEDTTPIFVPKKSGSRNGTKKIEERKSGPKKGE